ncbi:hypothetical protein D7M11_03165 [Paenibacillus ginsengarvi]|uniref:Uncharacterized protein n=2 Tax=Paenibacillus ginsengarvi TaxID=400777 RepID=A0A3B0CZY9_9BACL|nr:hypothetical protein D7M11_03165 [Paenibacillus ginsengarvi]
MANITYTNPYDTNGIVDYFMENDEHLINNPVFTDFNNIVILKNSLFSVLSQINTEKEFHDMLNYKNLLYKQLVHYSDSIEQSEELKEDYHELIVHRIYIGTEVKILSWIYQEMYGGEPDLSNPENNSPQGFLRYLKLNCKPDVTAHFIGLALRQYVVTKYPEEAFYADEAAFTGSYNFLAEFVLETDDVDRIVKTVAEQQEELVWLRDQLIASEEKLQQTPDDSATAEEQQKHIVNFMTERLEMEFLSQIVIRLF